MNEDEVLLNALLKFLEREFHSGNLRVAQVLNDVRQVIRDKKFK